MQRDTMYNSQWAVRNTQDTSYKLTQYTMYKKRNKIHYARGYNIQYKVHRNVQLGKTGVYSTQYTTSTMSGDTRTIKVIIQCTMRK